MGQDYVRLLDWLRANAGPGNYAIHSQSSIVMNSMAVYFRTIEVAHRFVDELPFVALADRTQSSGYTSPYKFWASGCD